MSECPENVVGVFMIFLVIAIAGWMMLDIEITRPLGVGWLLIGVLGMLAIFAAVIMKVLGEG